jgi:23S rRNA (adenine2503-C2)-methyltransferase
MGEPMLNYTNVLTSAHILNDNMGMNVSSQKISISTVGIAPMMRKFIHDEEPFHLILSLHSMIQEKRELIMPVAKKYSIDELIDLIRLYYEKRRDWVTIAYIMIKNVNMDIEDISRLKFVLRELKVKLNFIPYNSIEGLEYDRPSPDEIKQFYEEFLDLDLPVNIRKTQGKDIKGACGQLIIESFPIK